MNMLTGVYYRWIDGMVGGLFQVNEWKHGARRARMCVPYASFMISDASDAK
jgi:hypothetical protein